jgi:hypothetical protein
MGMILRGMLGLLLAPPAVHQAGALAVVKATVDEDRGISFASHCMLAPAFVDAAYH